MTSSGTISDVKKFSVLLDDVNSTLMEYMKAYNESQIAQLRVYKYRGALGDTDLVEELLKESHRLDRLYQLKWINELISSRVFQARDVIDENTKKRFAGTEILLETIPRKWEARARLDTAEDAYLSKSSENCSTKEGAVNKELYKTAATLEEMLFNSDIGNALVNKIAEVEHHRLHYLQCKSVSYS
uniref:Uncharacterized protein n=1 Tax=Trichobilharzia regenti TaxID=157069 RepID=A0AA85K4X3_TRIRE|nr:unnamed protein product [Trichobilharzia regenti]